MGVDALLRDAVDALHHLIGLVEGVLADRLGFVVLDVGLQDQVAAVIVGTGRVRLPAVHRAVHFLIEIVVAVIGVVAAVARLIGQVPQGVIAELCSLGTALCIIF